MHLIIDGYVSDPKKIEDKEFIFNFLDMYPEQIQMTKVSTPQVTQHSNPGIDGKGMSGFVLLAESHISIHIFPEQSYVNIDIFSCRGFNCEQATQALLDKFGLINSKSYILDRPYPDIS